jgi:hypothetical protein
MRWKQRWEPCRKHYLTQVAARLQQKVRDTPPALSLCLQKPAVCRYFLSGRCWVRTSDLLLVREKMGVAKRCRRLQNPHT